MSDRPFLADQLEYSAAAVLTLASHPCQIMVVRLAEEKEPLTHAAFGSQVDADQRNNVSANQRFLLLVRSLKANLPITQ
jgi:hypothetical protein